MRPVLGRGRRAGDERDAQLALYRAVVEQLTAVCEASATGDSEARALPVPGAEAVPELVRAQDALNRALDVSDAFVREAGAVLDSAAAGRFHRRLLPGGLRGAYRGAAGLIEGGRTGMQRSAQQLAEADGSRRVLADAFEVDVLGVAEQVATAATELSASAQGLGAAAGAASSEAERAAGTVQSLTQASEEIQQVVSVIGTIADQTRLLALNATIESARAGEAGRGFAVVAAEVKELADQTGRATEQVSQQVASIRAQAQGAVQAIAGIGGTVLEMNELVQGVRAAVDGAGSWGGAGDVTGLSRLAEELRVKIDGFLAGLRG